MSRVDVTLGVKNAKFKRGMEQAKGQVKKFSGVASKSLKQASGQVNSFRGIASQGFNFGQAAGIGALLVGLDKVTDRFDKIHKLSLRLSTDVEPIQRLEFIGSQNRVSLDEITNALTRLNRKAADLENTALQKAFSGLNIDAEKFQSLGLEEKLGVLADAFNSSENEGLAFKHMFTLLEDDAKKLVPLFKKGSVAIEEWGNKATVASQEQVEAMVKVRDELDAAKNTITGGVGIALATVIRFFKAMVAVATVAAIAVSDAVTSTSRALKQFKKGEFGPSRETIKAMISRMKGVGEQMGDAARDGFNGADEVDLGGNLPGGVSPEALAQQEQSSKLVAERLRLEKEIAALQEEAADRALTTEEKLREAKEKSQEAFGKLFDLEEERDNNGSTPELDNRILAAQLEAEKSLLKERDLKDQIAAEKKSAAEAEAQVVVDNSIAQKESELESLKDQERELLENRDGATRDADGFRGGVDRLQSIGLGAGGVNFDQNSEVVKQTRLAVEANKRLEAVRSAIELQELTIEEDEF